MILALSKKLTSRGLLLSIWVAGLGTQPDRSRIRRKLNCWGFRARPVWNWRSWSCSDNLRLQSIRSQISIGLWLTSWLGLERCVIQRANGGVIKSYGILTHGCWNSHSICRNPEPDLLLELYILGIQHNGLKRKGADRQIRPKQLRDMEENTESRRTMPAWMSSACTSWKLYCIGQFLNLGLMKAVQLTVNKRKWWTETCQVKISGNGPMSIFPRVRYRTREAIVIGKYYYSYLSHMSPKFSHTSLGANSVFNMFVCRLCHVITCNSFPSSQPTCGPRIDYTLFLTAVVSWAWGRHVGK